ncbi:hypothetical protein [Xanthobacter sp. VNH20]|uniref:hypothetical protein n=1 Tax=Xanthobacter sp. VNH20 TaxID=3156616 RepID=UPI0032B324CB
MRLFDARSCCWRDCSLSPYPLPPWLKPNRRSVRSGKKLAPKLVHDRVVLELALANPRRKASRPKETADE